MNAKVIATSLGAAALAAMAAQAATAQDTRAQGGFKGPTAVEMATVAQASEMDDEATVKLQGYIVKALGDEKYEFQDDTGTITVEIDDEDWRGLEVGPGDRVELTAEVDREWKRVELEAEDIRLVQ
jgi:uncharacterized protein (TIGR00156 family)